MKSPDSVLADLLGKQLDALQGVVRPKVLTSLRSRCEEHATTTFRAGLEASGLSQRGFAKRIGIDERLVRDYLSGARAVPLWVLHALPRRGQLGAIQAELEKVPKDDESDDPGSERGAA